MDAQLCRETLGRLLAEESGLLGKLAVLLDAEQTILANNDIDALEAASETRAACMSDLMRVEDERRSLCRMHGRDSDTAGLEQLLNWCDPGRTLQTKWAECAAGALRCRQLNDRNGLIVAARLKRVEGVLNIISGRNNAPTVYGRTGAYAQAPVGRMVRSEA